MESYARQTRGRVLVFLPIAVLVVGALILWILPAALTREPSHGMAASEQLKATNDVRAPLVGFLVAVGAAGTLWFTSRSYVLNREGHVTDRCTKAVGQLGDPSSAVRIGGVYALERIGNDSVKDRRTVIFVVGAFIRERSKSLRERQNEPAEDVKAGFRVVGRLLQSSDIRLDLRDADLRHADLSRLPPDRVMLDGANVDGAKLPGSLS
jgi:hypothetical protein